MQEQAVDRGAHKDLPGEAGHRGGRAAGLLRGTVVEMVELAAVGLLFSHRRDLAPQRRAGMWKGSREEEMQRKDKICADGRLIRKLNGPHRKIVQM